jgi:hypothetical protein
MNGTTNATQPAESPPKLRDTLQGPKIQQDLSPDFYGAKKEVTGGPIKEAEKEFSGTTTEKGWEMVTPLRGNGTIAGSLSRLNEMIVRRDQMWQEYMGETDDLLSRMDEKLARYRRYRTGRIEKMTKLREENEVHPAHEESMPLLTDTCLYCLDDECDGCPGY